jgi:hypothetical protein
MTLRPRLAASLPFAPKHWQIHHTEVIDPSAQTFIPEIWVATSEKSGKPDARPGRDAKTDEDQRIFS